MGMGMGMGGKYGGKKEGVSDFILWVNPRISTAPSHPNLPKPPEGLKVLAIIIPRTPRGIGNVATPRDFPHPYRVCYGKTEEEKMAKILLHGSRIRDLANLFTDTRA